MKKIKVNKQMSKKIKFKTHNLGEPLDNLTRDNFYPDPIFKLGEKQES
ncbi:MAG: hypothetical protein UU23_C0004G0039 [Candidatus Curtissbacteria bacterium GW2011_GWA1_40_9]|uniref:Uncharacterized protein n=1 Tax=Candidatus Curtissbacteria bacterium GW2011_GWA1_40_9 TaxID=1618408 RepID=A0A0G0WRR2_9BACT|nr:MAG: hypothetical protein UU23_C0004G0039 [Candidatus Curtissbacteria bacterium GW2011_GWA1_40_9]